jgi:hypothetical protein
MQLEHSKNLQDLNIRLSLQHENLVLKAYTPLPHPLTLHSASTSFFLSLNKKETDPAHVESGVLCLEVSKQANAVFMCLRFVEILKGRLLDVCVFLKILLTNTMFGFSCAKRNLGYKSSLHAWLLSILTINFIVSSQKNRGTVLWCLLSSVFLKHFKKHSMFVSRPSKI